MIDANTEGCLRSWEEQMTFAVCSGDAKYRPTVKQHQSQASYVISAGPRVKIHEKGEAVVNRLDY